MLPNTPPTPSHRTRRTLSVTADAYARLRREASDAGLSLSQHVEALIRRVLAGQPTATR